MLKRFMIGFVLGLGLMYYYLQHSEDVASRASNWAEESATNYRGDARHRAVDEVLGGSRR